MGVKSSQHEAPLPQSFHKVLRHAAYDNLPGMSPPTRQEPVESRTQTVPLCISRTKQEVDTQQILTNEQTHGSQETACSSLQARTLCVLFTPPAVAPGKCSALCRENKCMWGMWRPLALGGGAALGVDSKERG